MIREKTNKDTEKADGLGHLVKARELKAQNVLKAQHEARQRRDERCTQTSQELLNKQQEELESRMSEVQLDQKKKFEANEAAGKAERDRKRALEAVCRQKLQVIEDERVQKETAEISRELKTILAKGEEQLDKSLAYDEAKRKKNESRKLNKQKKKEETDKQEGWNKVEKKKTPKGKDQKPPFRAGISNIPQTPKRGKK